MANNVIEKLLVNIEANAAQLQAELAKGGTAVQAFGKQTSGIAKGADGIGERYSRAAITVASAAESMARSGNVAGQGLKQIIVQGSNMAFLFGPQGAVVGAVGIASLAIIEYFRRTEDETRRVVDEVRRLGQVARGAAADAASTRLTTIDADIARLRSQIEDIEGRKAQAGGVMGRTGLQGELDRSRRELADRERDRALAQNQLQAETQRLQAEELRNLQALVRANAASADETNRAKAIESALRGELRQTNLTLQRRAEILGLLGELEAKPRKVASAARDDGTAAAVAAANAELDALRKRSEDNAAAIATAVQNATRDLASMAGDTVAVLTMQIDELTRKFRALGATDQQLRQIVAPLEAARTAAVALNAAVRTITIPDQVRRALGLLPQKLQSGMEGAAAESASFADKLAAALSVAAGLVTALDGAGSSMTRLISGAAQAATGFAQLATLASKAEGIGSLFSSGAGIASALPALGGIVAGVAGLASALGGGESAAERAQRQLLEQNNQRLKELRDTLARSVGQSISGEDRRTLEAVYRMPFVREGPPSWDELTGEWIPTETPKSAKELLADLTALGFGMDKLRAAAKAVGITLSETPTVEELATLGNALGALDFAAFAHSFAGAMAKLDAELTLFPQRFQTNVDRFKAVVAELNNPDTGAPALFKGLEGLDTSTAEGKQAALEEIQRLFDMYRDGKLTADDLRGLSLDEFFETLKRLKQELGDLPQERTAAEQFAKALEAFGTAVELGSMSAEEKLAKAKDLFASLFPDLAGSIDTSSAEAFKTSIQSIIDGFAADGDLTAAEQAQLAVLRLLIEAFGEVSAAADDAAQQAEAAMVAARALVFSLADAFLAVHDITDPIEILKVRAAALAEAFPELAEVMAQFDLSTQAGRDALEAWIQSLVDSPEALKAMADGLGISIDDLLARLLNLESAADDAAAAVETLAQKLGAAFDSAEFDLQLEGITDPLEKLKRTSAAIGDVLPDIADIFKQFNTATAEGRAGAEAALIALAKSTDDAAVRSAVLKLLGQIRGVKGDETAPGAGLGGGGGGGRTGVAATASITEVTGNRLVDLFGRNVVATEQIRDSLAAALSRTLAAPAAISPPALPSWVASGSTAPGGSGGSGAVVLQMTLPQIVFQGPVTTASEAELARLIQQRFMDLIQSQLAREFLVALRRAGVARTN